MARVLYLCSARSFRSDHPGRKIASVAQCWRGMGNEVVLVCGGDIEVTPPGIQAQEYGRAAYHNQWFRKLRILGPLVRSASERRDLLHDAAMLKHLQGVCCSGKPDLVWERSSRLHCAGLTLARELKVPYVLEWKDHLVEYRFSFYRSRALAMEILKNREADHVVVESGVLRTGLAGQGVDVRKVIIAHNAVEPREFVRELAHRTRVRTELGVSDDTMLVGYLGSYAFYHDAARLVLAADLCRKKKAKANLKFLMVGAGKEYSQTHELAVKLGLLDELVVMRPGVPNKEVPGILAALDIAVLPGSTDIICPVKVQEYMACELPVVLPDYSCNREVVRDRETGFFFEPKNATSLAEMISLLAANSGLRRSVGERARAEVLRRFTWEATWGAALSAALDARNGSPVRGTPGVSIPAKN